METEADFQDGWLPTLDAKTQVSDDGVIDYKFFKKPMSNNIALQFGTALPSSTIFSSLRQEVTRRMLNTSLNVDMKERVQIIEDYIGILVNSGHKYPYIKAVILQGISRFLYMVKRSKLDKSDPKYMPLHRRAEHRREERLITKYVGAMTWFTDQQYGDPYKSEWKKWLTCKFNRGNRKMPKRYCINKSLSFQGHNSQNNTGLSQTTTVMFVPPSAGSKLFKEVAEAEIRMSKNCSWKAKVVEQPGTPLLMSFMVKFPIEIGCCRGSLCAICDNNGVKCSTKNVVYAASCIKCNKNAGGSDRNHVYVGETSRPWRERILEHVSNADNWKIKSFILDHWMTSHPTSCKRPEFEFKILSCYPDALRRQLSEGLFIIEKGGLNRRNEFGQNKLCRMQVSKSEDEQEKLSKEVMIEKKLYEEKINNFCSVMKNVARLSHCQNGTTHLNFRSSKKRTETYQTVRFQTRVKKLKMDASTPQDGRWRRQVDLMNLSGTSPIMAGVVAKDESNGEDMSNNNVQGRGLISKTNISEEMDSTALTPPKAMSSSQEMKSFCELTRNWTRAASSNAIIKTTSAPDLVDLVDNVMYKSCPYRQRTLSEGSGSSFMSLSPWDDKMMAEKFINEHEMENKKLDPTVTDNTNDVSEVMVVKKARGQTMSYKNSALSLGANADPNVLKQKATPGSPVRIKRPLQTSPGTPSNASRRRNVNSSPAASPSLRLGPIRPQFKTMNRPKNVQKKKIQTSKRGVGKNKLIQTKIQMFYNAFDPGIASEQDKDSEKEDVEISSDAGMDPDN